MNDYEFHSVADIFPLIEGQEYEDLKADIKKNGLLQPIWLYGGKIIDGRNRYRACVDVGVEPRFVWFSGKGEDLVGFVVSLNLKRRHLEAGQRAMVGLKIKEYKRKDALEHMRLGGGDRKSNDYKSGCKIIDNPIDAAKDAADLVGTNRQYIIDAEKIRAVRPDLAEKITKGEMNIPQAKKELRREEIRERLSTVAVNLPDGKFNVVLADPPWKYDFAETENRAIENQYPTMSLADIKAVDVPLEDNAVLFLWATAPKLREALDVLCAWGFTYKTCAVWDKKRIGMGYWFRGQHELLLVGVKGDFSPPLPENRFSSIISEERREHSKKPDCVYELIEKMLPGQKYLELFARNKRLNWEAWGNEAE